MASYTNCIFAGWLIVGNIKNQLTKLAWNCDVEINVIVSTGFLGRDISFRVSGSHDNVALFKKAVESARTRSMLA